MTWHTFTLMLMTSSYIVMSTQWGGAIADEPVCTKLTSCSCQYPDGRLVDLSPLSTSPNGQPTFFDIPDNLNSDDKTSAYSYNPCDPISEGTCENAAICQHKNGSYFNLGTQDSVTINNNPMLPGSLFLEYNKTDSLNVPRRSVIFLVCTNNTAKSVFSIDGETEPGSGSFAFTLFSPYCCPDHKDSGNSAPGLSYGFLMYAGPFLLLLKYLR